jgi:hypothetical protein
MTSDRGERIRLLPRVPSPACGKGWRATSAFTRVFDALWASRERVLPFATPLSPLACARDPLAVTRGEGIKSQKRGEA